MKKPIKIAFFNRKGGTAKTTSTINVSGELAKRGYKVLLVDADSQGNASQNLNCYDPERFSISDVLLGDCDVNDAIISTQTENLDILPSNIRLQETELKMTVSSSRIDIYMLKHMKNIKKDYDFIIVDCSPSLGVLTTNILSYVEEILVPIKTDKNSLEGYENLAAKIVEVKEDCNPNLNILGVFLTVFEKQTVLDQEIYRQCKQKFAERFIDVQINKCIDIREAPVYNKPICEYAKNSVGSKKYSDLTDEILKRVGGEIG